MDSLRCKFPSRGLALGAAFALLASVAIPVLAAATCASASGRQTIPLVELFTSEGCDSCPPADRWLSSTFPAAPGDVTASVLAFHVDYWDRLGWKDRFASPRYTERQYEAMRANGDTFVYTPQVLLQGRELPVSQRSRTPELVAASARRAPRATIALDASVADSGDQTVRARAVVADVALRRNAVFWLAYTESGLVSDVRAGENRGVRLEHDHVVRALLGPYPLDGNGEASATVSIPRQPERGRAGALVAFVQDGRSGDVLQTLTLPACRGG